MSIITDGYKRETVPDFKDRVICYANYKLRNQVLFPSFLQAVMTFISPGFEIERL